MSKIGTNLSLYRLFFAKCEPIVIASGTFIRETYLVILKHEQLFGLGAANPFKLITGDTPKDVIRDAKKLRKLPLDPHKDGLKKLHLLMDKKKIKSMTLRAAVDVAYHDLVSQIKGIPVYRLYAKKLTYVDNSITVFLKDSIKHTQEEAVKIYKAFPELKVLKIKLSGKKDLERVTAIKKVSPKNIKFVLDANQAYKDPIVAVKELSKMGKILGNIILVEQPCPKKDLKSLKYITDNLKGMMVFADEAAATLEDVKKIVVKKAAHGVNIKVQKAGGIYPSIQIAQYCKKHGLKIMAGAMIEDTIGLTADAHFAVSNSNLVLTDLDTDIDLPKYIKGGSYIRIGKRKINQADGLGIKLCSRRLKRLQVKKELIIKEFI